MIPNRCKQCVWADKWDNHCTCIDDPEQIPSDDQKCGQFLEKEG